MLSADIVFEAKLEDGEMEIFSSTQNLTELQVSLGLESYQFVLI